MRGNRGVGKIGGVWVKGEGKGGLRWDDCGVGFGV